MFIEFECHASSARTSGDDILSVRGEVVGGVGRTVRAAIVFSRWCVNEVEERWGAKADGGSPDSPRWLVTPTEWIAAIHQ